MDGRSDNGGESEARAAMILAGVAAPELQVEITRPGNAGYYLADYGWQMPNGSWMLAELHGLGKFEDDAQNDSEHAAAKTIEMPSCATRTCVPWATTSFISSSQTPTMSKRSDP